MDKIKINNQVVGMRKFVKQGKIRVINKFVKEIQLLRNRKGGEQKVAKCQRKADRLLEEVAILKKIKPDTVSRLALSKSKDWKAVLSQKKGVSPEERCHALLVSYDPVQKEVEKFYSENSYLMFKIPTLIQEWEEKNSSSTPQKNKNSFTPKSKSNEITKGDPSCSAKENKLIEVKSGMQSSEPGKQSVMQKDNDNPGTLKDSGSEDMMDDDREDEGTKDIRSGHCEVSYRNQEDSDDNEEESGDNEEDSDGKVENSGSHCEVSYRNHEDSDDNEEESDDNEEDSDGKVENSDGNVKNNDDDNEEDSDDNEESDDQEGSDESDMHSDDEVREEGNSCDNDLKNKSKASSIKESKLKSKPAKKDSNILSLSPVKTANNYKNKIPILQKNVPLDSNSTKAVALVNLNELMDMDEIPIARSKMEEELVSESKKRKKDSFFLKEGEEEFSGSDQSGEEDSNDDEEDGAFTRKNIHSNSFNKKGSFVYHGRTKMEENSHNFRNKGFASNAPHGKKFDKGDKKFQNDFHSKQKFNKFNKNDTKPYSDQQNFKKKEWNRSDESNRKGSKPFGNFRDKFNKNDTKPYSDQQNFKQNKWNRSDESDRKGSKPFSNFQERKQTYSKNKPDNHPGNSFAKTVKKDDPPLHPSWEAKRKLKQATNTKFQGKRMVFDD